MACFATIGAKYTCLVETKSMMGYDDNEPKTKNQFMAWNYYCAYGYLAALVFQIGAP
jgi:hypothetical protein